MFSVPSQHNMLAAVAPMSPQKIVEGGFVDLNEFIQQFARDVSRQLQSLGTLEDIHTWASSALPTFCGQAEKKTTALRDTVLMVVHSAQTASPLSNVLARDVPPPLPPVSPGQNTQLVFDATSPRSHRVQSIDTGEPATSSSRTGSLLRMHPNAADNEAAHPHSSTSPQSNVSRPASFSHRVGSFTKKVVNGIDVPMLKDDASGAVVDALNDTYSLASRGSWRGRRGGPGSMFSGQHAPLAAVPSPQGGVARNNNFDDMKRRAYLSFVHLEGMPNLNIEMDQQELRTRFSRLSKRHTNVFRDRGDLESLLDECNLPQIHDINSLEFNIFEEYQKYGENAFTIVVMNVLLKYTFITSLQLNIPTLLTFVKTVQSFYRSENPFHNALHAADVLQTTHLYLCQRDVKENFSDVELFALLTAAMCIDVGHLGVNNKFLVRTRHPLATLFSDTSPMEAMSSALTFCILDDPDCNFFNASSVWDREIDNEYRALVTDLILRSDDSEHAAMCNDIDEILAKGVIGDDGVPHLLSAVLHAADVSYMSKPRHIYLEWAFRFIAENYRQGDAETEYKQMYINAHPDVPVDSETKWLQVSKLCDRNAMSATELERSIMEHIVLPFITLLHPFLPSVWIERLEANYRYLLEDEDEKTIVIQNGVQEQLWKKGILTHWEDVPPNSGKNFLVVIRNWIAAEVPDGEQYGDTVQQPSKLIFDSNNNSQPFSPGLCVALAPSAQNSTSSRPSNVSELAEDVNSSQSKGTLTAGDTLKVKDSGVQKKRLSVTQQTGPSQPTVTMSLSTVHVLTGEMLKHMHTLLHAGVPGSWDAHRETAIFAQEWVKLLRTLEAQEYGPVLLSGLVVNNQLVRSLAASHAATTNEEAESIALVEVLRDQNSPFAHFRPGKPAAAQTAAGSSSLTQSGTNTAAAGSSALFPQTSSQLLSAETGGAALARRESINDLSLNNSPFACAVLLTQMWWVVFGMVEELVAGSTLQSPHNRIATPVGPGLTRVQSDEDMASVSQSGAHHHRTAAPTMMLRHRMSNDSPKHGISRRDSVEPDSPKHLPNYRKDSVDSLEASGKGPTPPAAVAHSPFTPTYHHDATALQQPANAPSAPVVASSANPSSPVVPTPPSAIRELMQNARRPSEASRLQLVNGGDAPDPSPVKYVLAKRNSLTPQR